MRNDCAGGGSYRFFIVLRSIVGYGIYRYGHGDGREGILIRESNNNGQGTSILHQIAPSIKIN